MVERVTVENMIGQSDLVISLLPVPFHPVVAELCIKRRKHLVTASYISPAMKGLHERFAPLHVIKRNVHKWLQGFEL